MASRGRKASRRLGVGLVEVALGLGILSAAMAGLAQVSNDSSSTVRASAAATRMEQIHLAAADYVRANQATLITNTTATGSVVTVPAGRTTVAGAIPTASAGGLPSLQGGGFLPSGYVDRNSYGHSHSVLVRQPTAGNLEFLVVQHGGIAIRDADLGRVANRLGATGGAMLARPVAGVPTTAVVGTGGGWRLTASQWVGAAGVTPTAGRAVSYSGLSGTAGGGLADFLYRNAIPGVPEANTMHTAIDMGGTAGANDINRVGNLDVQRIANNATGGVNVNVDDNLVVRDGVTACSSGTANCALTLGATGGGQSGGRFESINNGWMYFTAQGTGVAAGNGGLAINQVSAGNGGNLWIGGTTYAQGPVAASSTLYVAGAVTAASTVDVTGTVVARNGVRVTNDWVRIYGGGGVYFESFGSGLHMVDPSWIRTYGGAGIYAAAGAIRSDINMQSPIYYDSNDYNFYVDPATYSRIQDLGVMNNITGMGQGLWLGTPGDASRPGWIVACRGNSVGCGIQLSDDSGFYDYNNGWATHVGLMGSSLGLYVARGAGANGGNIVAEGYVRTGAVSNVGWGCDSGSIATNAANGEMLFCRYGTYREPGASMLGRLYGGGGDWGSFSCEPNYHIVWFHMTVGNSNNAFFSQCVKDGY